MEPELCGTRHTGDWYGWNFYFVTVIWKEDGAWMSVGDLACHFLVPIAHIISVTVREQVKTREELTGTSDIPDSKRLYLSPDTRPRLALITDNEVQIRFLSWLYKQIAGCPPLPDNTVVTFAGGWRWQPYNAMYLMGGGLIGQFTRALAISNERETELRMGGFPDGSGASARRIAAVTIRREMEELWRRIRRNHVW